MRTNNNFYPNDDHPSYVRERRAPAGAEVIYAASLEHADLDWKSTQPVVTSIDRLARFGIGLGRAENQDVPILNGVTL